MQIEKKEIMRQAVYYLNWGGRGKTKGGRPTIANREGATSVSVIN
jgi:hypothetical protein